MVVGDADPQGSALSWAQRAAYHGEPLGFEVRPLSAADLRVAAGGVEAGPVMVVDTPPGTARVIDAAIDVADVVIIPTGCAPADIDRVWPTLEITAHRPTTVLLTGVDLRTTLSRTVQEVFAEQNVAVLHAFVRRRQAITASFGHAPQSLYDYADVWAQLRDELELHPEKRQV